MKSSDFFVFCGFISFLFYKEEACPVFFLFVTMYGRCSRVRAALAFCGAGIVLALFSMSWKTNGFAQREGVAGAPPCASKLCCVTVVAVL